MKKAVYTVVSIDCLYIFIRAVASLLYATPVISIAVKYAAFVIPLLVFLVICRRGCVECGSVNAFPDRRGFAVTLTMIAPALFIVMGISLLTTLLMQLAGGKSAMPEYVFFDGFMLHALLPSVCEELVFRFVPLLVIAPHSKKSAVLISTLLFAFVHGDPYQIPYAFVAGLIYMTLDVATESVAPSIILHLCNNSVALLWQGTIQPSGNGFTAILIIAALALMSVAVAVLIRRSYARVFGFVLDRADRVDVPVILVAPIGIGFIISFVSFL